jgi:hypothetical protein
MLGPECRHSVVWSVQQVGLEAKTMRLNRQWPDSELRTLQKQLIQEYPAVPSDVTALVLQMARTDISPDEGPARLLAHARRLLGRSVLMHAIADVSAPDLAMAS